VLDTRLFILRQHDNLMIPDTESASSTRRYPCTYIDVRNYSYNARRDERQNDIGNTQSFVLERVLIAVTRLRRLPAPGAHDS
jgi:hypothetical protein